MALNVNVNLCGVLNFESTPPPSPTAEMRAVAVGTEEGGPAVELSEAVIDLDHPDAGQETCEGLADAASGLPVVEDLKSNQPECVTLELEGPSATLTTFPVIVDLEQHQEGRPLPFLPVMFKEGTTKTADTQTIVVEALQDLERGHLEIIEGPGPEKAAVQAPGPWGASCGTADLSPVTTTSTTAGKDSVKSKVVVMEVHPFTPASGRSDDHAPAMVEEPERPLVTSDALDNGGHYDLTESVWDAMIFVGLDCTGTGGSMVTVMAFVLVAGVQLVFTVIVYQFMLNDPMSQDTLDSLMRFRAGPAHDASLADKENQRSMLQMLCDGDKSLPFASYQSTLYNDLQNFTQSGQLLANLAAILWLGFILFEINSILTHVHALVSIPTGPTRVVIANIFDEVGQQGKSKASKGQELEASQSSNQWASGLEKVAIMVALDRLDPTRLFVNIFFVQGLQLFIACFLGYIGLLYLAQTTSMEALVLNAVALKFILEIDELFFSTLCHIRIQRLIRNMEPIPLRNPRTMKGWRRVCCPFNWQVMAPFAYFTVYVLCMISVNLILFQPVQVRLRAAMDVLCSGSLDMVYGLNPLTLDVIAGKAQTDIAWAPFQLNVLSIVKPEIRSVPGWQVDPQALYAATNYPTSGIMIVPHAARLESARKVTPDDFNFIASVPAASARAVATMPQWVGCKDGDGPGFLANVKAFLRVPDATHCGDLAFACSWQNSSMLRVLCPVTCGCLHTPTESGMFGTVDYGCSAGCFTTGGMPEAIAKEQGRTCDDYEDPVGDKYVQLYLDTVFQMIYNTPDYALNLDQLLIHYGTHLGIKPAKFAVIEKAITSGQVQADVLARRWDLAPGVRHPKNLTGCDFFASPEISMLWQNNLCTEDWTRSFRYFCPVACGCDKAFVPGCPLACEV